MNQTEAIRQALDELGDEADADAIRAYLGRLKVKPTASFETIISHEKRKRRKPSAVPDLEAVSAARKLLEELGAEKVAEVVEALEKVHGACGDWDTVRKMFDAVGGSGKKK